MNGLRRFAYLCFFLIFFIKKIKNILAKYILSAAYIGLVVDIAILIDSPLYTKTES